MHVKAIQCDYIGKGTNTSYLNAGMCKAVYKAWNVNKMDSRIYIFFTKICTLSFLSNVTNVTLLNTFNGQVLKQ